MWLGQQCAIWTGQNIYIYPEPITAQLEYTPFATITSVLEPIPNVNDYVNKHVKYIKVNLQANLQLRYLSDTSIWLVLLQIMPAHSIYCLICVGLRKLFVCWLDITPLGHKISCSRKQKKKRAEHVHNIERVKYQPHPRFQTIDMWHSVWKTIPNLEGKEPEAARSHKAQTTHNSLLYACKVYLFKFPTPSWCQGKWNGAFRLCFGVVQIPHLDSLAAATLATGVIYMDAKAC